MNDDLTALVFELQRAPSATDKAKVLARAWRTVRGLKPVERRLLAREVGFDGAEELIEGLSGKDRGVFAPAAVLEAIGKLRSDPGFSVRRVIDSLRDPDRRDDLLVRGMDLVAESMTGTAELTLDPLTEEEETALHDEVLLLDEDDSEISAGVTAGDHRGVRTTPPVPGQEQERWQRQKPNPQPEPESRPGPETKPEPRARPAPRPEPQPEPEAEPEQPTPWDTQATGEEIVGRVAAVGVPSLFETVPDARPRGSSGKTEGSPMERLRELREALPDLERASVRALSERLDAFPEAWARRRALVAMIESDVPDEATAALDLIETLDREMDRRWCLATLARRGDLLGVDLDRALAMLSSPAAERRVIGLAAR